MTTIGYLYRRLADTLNDRLAPKGGWHGEGGMDVTQAAALVATGVFATIVIFAVFEDRAIATIEYLHQRLTDEAAGTARGSVDAAQAVAMAAVSLAAHVVIFVVSDGRQMEYVNRLFDSP